MLKYLYLLLGILLILLGVAWYNQGSPQASRRAALSADASQSSFENVENRQRVGDDIPPPGEIPANESLTKEAQQFFETILDPEMGNNARFEDRERSDIDPRGVVVGGGVANPETTMGGARAMPIEESRGGGNSGTTYDSSPELEALREAARLTSGSSLIPGFRAQGAGIEPDDAVAPTPRPTGTPDVTLKDVTGQARGYTMLYLMYDRARQTVEKQLEAMFRSKVQQLYLGVLIDGTFGRDFNYLSSVVRRVAREKRSLILVVYLSNGSTMRSEESQVNAPFSEFIPEEFRSRIQNDPAVQNTYVEIIKPVVPILQLNRRLNESNRNFVVVMLEDDLDDPSYLKMRSLAQSVIGNRATFIRNPHGKLPGSTSSGLGDPIESHDLSQIETLGIQDGFSLDGIGHALPNEEPNLISYEDARELAVTAASRGLRYFGLWRFERQGNDRTGASLPVNERSFEIPTEEDLQAEIDLLRAGLSEVR